MDNLEIKFVIERTGKWTQITIGSVEYVIKFDLKDADDTLQSMSCWLSDFTSMWTEIVEADEIVERLKRCNPLLACKEMMTRILTKITTVPQIDNHIQLTGLNHNDDLHLRTKYFLSDGSDEIPLKFYWSLEKGCSQSFYERFSKIMLLKIIDLEKTNDFLIETIREKDEALSKKVTFVVGDEDCNKEDKDLDKDQVDANLSSSTEISHVCHEGITCNNCGEDIFGHRYNCVECEDFDLCMTCEHKEMQHAHHIMARYATPDDKARGESFFRGSSRRTPHSAKRTRSSRI